MYDTRDDPMSDVPLPADWYESHVMGAADPLWQWDVHSDRIVLSPEAANLLVGALTRLDGRGWLHETGAEGRWVYDCAREEYTLDRNCARLLRLPDSVGLRLPRQTIRDMLGADAARFFSSRFSRLLNARDHDGSFVERALLHLPDGSRKIFWFPAPLWAMTIPGSPSM